MDLYHTVHAYKQMNNSSNLANVVYRIGIESTARYSWYRPFWATVRLQARGVIKP